MTLRSYTTAPSVALDSTNEVLSGLNTNLEMSINDSTYEPVTNDIIADFTTGTSISDMINDLLPGETATLSFRRVASATVPQSRVKNIVLYSRLFPPTALLFNDVSFVMSGVSSSMQYRAQGASTWTNITSTTVNLGNLLNGSADTIIEVRFKPTSTNSASEPVVMTLPMLNPSPANLDIDYTSELVAGCVADKAYQYSTNGTSWTSVTASPTGTFSIASVITTSARTLHIREAATQTTPYTDYTQISIPARGAAPTGLAFSYNDSTNPDMAVLTGLTSAMEYKLNAETVWIPYIGNDPMMAVPTADQAYVVRYRGTATDVPSRNLSLTLSKRGTAPSVTINTTTERLLSVTVAHEVSVGGGAYVPVSQQMATDFTTSGVTISDYMDSIASGETLTLSFRIPATASAPASLPKTITLYARAAAPNISGFSYNTTNRRITGTNTSMMWRVPGGSWTNCTTSYITAPSGSTTIEFAFKPTTSASRSWIAVFII